MTDTHARLARLSAARWRLAVILTAAMTAIYVGFTLLIAFNKPLLATVLVPGLSLGILLGVIVIITAWVLIMIYVRWTNRHYDAAVADIRRDHLHPTTQSPRGGDPGLHPTTQSPRGGDPGREGR